MGVGRIGGLPRGVGGVTKKKKKGMAQIGSSGRTQRGEEDPPTTRAERCRGGNTDTVRKRKGLKNCLDLQRWSRR